VYRYEIYAAVFCCSVALQVYAMAVVVLFRLKHTRLVFFVIFIWQCHQYSVLVFVVGSMQEVVGMISAVFYHNTRCVRQLCKQTV